MTAPSESLTLVDSCSTAATLHSLEREIAFEHCRVSIECNALRVPSSYPTPVYDISQIDTPYEDQEVLESIRQDIARSVRYLDALQMLVRPLAECSQFVAFRPEGAKP